MLFFFQLLLSFGSHQKDLDKENETELPDYLPDEEEPIIDDKAMARPGKGDQRGGGWLSSAASFFTNSFYW